MLGLDSFQFDSFWLFDFSLIFVRKISVRSLYTIFAGCFCHTFSINSYLSSLIWLSFSTFIDNSVNRLFSSNFFSKTNTLSSRRWHILDVFSTFCDISRHCNDISVWYFSLFSCSAVQLFSCSVSRLVGHFTRIFLYRYRYIYILLFMLLVLKFIAKYHHTHSHQIARWTLFEQFFSHLAISRGTLNRTWTCLIQLSTQFQ